MTPQRKIFGSMLVADLIGFALGWFLAPDHAAYPRIVSGFLGLVIASVIVSIGLQIVLWVRRRRLPH